MALGFCGGSGADFADRRLCVSGHQPAGPAYVYVIDLNRHAPRHDAAFRRNFYMGGHLNAAGYQITAWQTMTYIDWIIRNNPEDFTQIAFVGKGGVHHVGHKW